MSSNPTPDSAPAKYRAQVILQKQRPIKETVYLVMLPPVNEGFEGLEIAETRSAERAKQICDALNSEAALASRVAELEAALNDLLQIAQLAEYYSPGELAEFPDRVRKAIETAEALLKAGAS